MCDMYIEETWPQMVLGLHHLSLETPRKKDKFHIPSTCLETPQGRTDWPHQGHRFSLGLSYGQGGG